MADGTARMLAGSPPGEVTEVGYSTLRVRYLGFSVFGYKWEFRRTMQGYGRCVRCGEFPLSNDVAEVADGIVHASCMREGEQIA
jgi:hypothetical protein